MQCAKRGVTALLRLPLDVPLVQSSDIDELLAVQCAAPGLVIVPSRDGTGTNAILRTPPTLFPSHFGSGSFVNHCAEAQRVGSHILVRRNARLEMDVDDETDLRALVQQDLSGTETGAWLQSSGLMARFAASKQNWQVGSEGRNFLRPETFFEERQNEPSNSLEAKMAEQLPDKYADLLSNKKAFGNLGTLNSDGSPQVTPVWVDYDGKHVRVNSARGRLKDKNIARDPRVSLSIQDPENPYRYLEIRGKVVEATEKAPTITSTAWPRNIWAKTSTRSGNPAKSE